MILGCDREQKRLPKKLEGSNVSLGSSSRVGKDVGFKVVSMMKEPGVSVSKATGATSRGVSCWVCWGNIFFHEEAKSMLPGG